MEVYVFPEGGGVRQFAIVGLCIKKCTHFACFSSFSGKLTDQLPPLIAAIDSSCKTGSKNIFSGAMFTLNVGIGGLSAPSAIKIARKH
jgi:hypothetical protein